MGGPLTQRESTERLSSEVTRSKHSHQYSDQYPVTFIIITFYKKKRPRKAYLYQDNSLNSNVDLPKSNNAVKTDIWLCFEKDGLLWGAEA